MSELMTWAEIVDTCSRLHTTRTRENPWGELREDSQMIDVLVKGRPAQIVPTRMHEPGLYWRYMDVPNEHPESLMRSYEDIWLLHGYAAQGMVERGLTTGGNDGA